MHGIDPKEIALRHYLRRKADPGLTTLSVAVDARRDLKAASVEVQARAVHVSPDAMRQLERELERELLAAVAQHFDG